MPKKMRTQVPIGVHVAGTFQVAEGYPNVQHKLEILQKDQKFDTTVFNHPIVLGINYKSKFFSLFSLLKIALKLSFGSLAVVFNIIRNSKNKIVYIPYPAVIVAWLLGCVPNVLRPKNIVLDGFISLYDTIVVDRKLIKPTSIVAKMLLKFERRAYSVATITITDTPANARYYASIFSLPEYKFIDLPLAIDEGSFNTKSLQGFHESKPSIVEKQLEVLFVGTMVPLHGIEYICNTIGKIPKFLASNTSINFTIIGTGQKENVLDEFLQTNNFRGQNIGVRRIQKWQSSDALAQEIKNTDLCLGIFGNESKSRRVWPFKNYCYLACGKALVTGKTPVAMELAGRMKAPPFVMVDVSDADALAELLASFAKDKSDIDVIGSTGAELYKAHLSHDAVVEKMYSLFGEKLEKSRRKRTLAQTVNFL